MPNDLFSRTVRRGDRGNDVRLTQEWLTFHRFSTAVDGNFGPATELAARRFQIKKKITASGVIDQPTQKQMLSPIGAVQKPIAAGSKSLRGLYVAYARQHLNQHPFEIGGQNCGPWVRLYMRGNEGPQWPWCAGFATFVLQQASKTMGVAAPHGHIFSCDVLAIKGQESGLFFSIRKETECTQVKPGYLFLVSRNPTDWTHIGIVESVQGEAMTTIEGNTNDEGSREGFEVCRRTRAIVGKDFLMV